jgi:hypothetical protein
MKITIISLDNWGYNQFIADALDRRDIAVKHIDYDKFKYAYPSVLHKVANFFTKTLFNYNFKREHLNRKLLQLLDNEEKQDAILVIKGDDLSIETIKKIKNSTHKLIAFLNDSMSRYPRMRKIHSQFDKVYSFERQDVQKYNFEFITNYIYFDYKNVPSEALEYGVFNISSLDKRSETIPHFASYFKAHNIAYKLIAFSKTHHEEFDALQIEQTTKTYDLNAVFKFVLKSRFLLDLQRPKQFGLSFRVLEALALNKKLITTNIDLKNYDFYNPNNIAIVDADHIRIDSEFFKTPYEAIDEVIIRNYHISTWVETVFELKNSTS